MNSIHYFLYHVKWGLYYWPYALITASFAFSIPEGIALLTNPKNTLSDYSWGQLHVFAHEHLFLHSFAWWASLAGWIAFTIVITAHIWFKVIP
jgi:hypothetical protein